MISQHPDTYFLELGPLHDAVARYEAFLAECVRIDGITAIVPNLLVDMEKWLILDDAPILRKYCYNDAEG